MPSLFTSSASNLKKSKPPYVTQAFLRRFIASSLAEDKGDGDHTSLACISSSASGKAQLIVKDTGIIAGVELAKMILKHADPSSRISRLIKDGEEVKPGDIVFTVSGKIRALLLSERLLLNVMQRMSGIATNTRSFVMACSGTKTKILDTRKTTPNFRIPEKWAVLIGGGSNHRMGLYDMILIKDNHIDFCGGITNAIGSAVKYLKKNRKKLRIVIEARNLDDVDEILRCGGVHRILLDNMTPAIVKTAVARINGRFETEVSGGIHPGNIREYAMTGTDFISVGALTHHVKSLDLSFKAMNV